MRLLRMHTPFHELTTPWICWRGSSGFLPWIWPENTQRAAEPPLSPELQQMFALARRMGYEMRPIARRFDAPRQTPGSRQSPNRDYRAPVRPRDYSRTKCFSCGQLGHTQVRCPKPDSSLPFRPSGWVDRSDGPQRNSGASPQGNEI